MDGFFQFSFFELAAVRGRLILKFNPECFHKTTAACGSAGKQSHAQEGMGGIPIYFCKTSLIWKKKKAK